MAGEKSTDIEIEQRIDTVVSLLCRFMSRRQILQYTSKKTDWNVTPRTIDDYISRAKEIIKEKSDPEQTSGMIRKNFEMLFGKNLQNEDFRECRAVLESMAKLTGVNEPDKKEIDIKGKKLAEIFGFDDKAE